MKVPYWWYVLYVRSNTEHRVAKYVNLAFINKGLPYELEAFSLESEQYYNSKKMKDSDKPYIRRPVFSNYIFIETNMPEEEFREAFFNIGYNSADIIRLLTYGKEGTIALRDAERIRLEYLFRGKRCLEHSVGYIEGDRVIITGGALVGMEGIIKKINRHHRSAQIEIDLFNETQTIDVALEIVSRR